MAAQCYSCKTMVQTLSVSWGKPNEPVGCCKLCHVLACGLHGTRVKSGPSFICVECQPSLLVASAASLVTNMDNTVQYLQTLINMIPREWVYKSLEDFKKKNSDYKEWVKETEKYSINWEVWSINDEFRTFFKNSKSEVIELLLAAALIIKKLYNDELPNEYPPDLDLLRKSLNDNNLNTNNEREIFITS